MASGELTPEQYEILFGDSPRLETDPPPPKSPPAAAPRAFTKRPWWKKKRFLLPITLFSFLGFIGALAQPAGDEPVAAVLGAREVAEETESSTSTTSVTTTTDQPATTSTAQATAPENAPASESGSIYERPVDPAELAAVRAALSSFTPVESFEVPLPYNRSDYADGWGDSDGDCQSDRHEILIDRSEIPVVMDGCNVSTGRWTDPYDNTVYTDARLVTIDHFVPLAAAHRAGGWAWDRETKRAFAADISFKAAHVPAGQGTNQDKGDQGPDQWRPQESAWCGYAIDWIAVKMRWTLQTTQAEVDALDDMLDTCATSESPPNQPTTTVQTADPSTSTTTSSTTTIVEVTDGPAQVRIANCDARSETVEIVNFGSEFIQLQGWVLHDEGRNHETDLDRITLRAGERVILLSGDETLDVPETLRWTGLNAWNNDGDEAFLLNDGVVVSQLVCSR